jgi:hypothetical protein
MDLKIMPLAITMLAGPQIMSAIIFVTNPKAVRTSVPFVAAVALAATVGVAIAAGIASLLGNSADLGSSSHSGSAGTIIQIALVGLLAAAGIKNYVNRETVEPPKWLGALQEAGPKEAFKTGLLVIGLMPSDIIIMLTVGTHLEQGGYSFVDAIPFIAATTLVAALPLLGFLIFHHRALTAMPKLREWMNTNAGLVNVIVCVIFIILILG